MENEIQRAHAVCNLIKETNGLINQKFNKDKKIKFAYKYWLLNPEDITELYDSLAKNYSKDSARLARIIGQFIDHQKITNIHRFSANFFDQDIEKIQNVTAKIRNNGNWLSLYDIEREFSSQTKSQNPVKYSYITQDGTIFKIDKDKTKDILGILIDENIPTAKCIVTGSFIDYANGNIDEYIKTLKK